MQNGHLDTWERFLSFLGVKDANDPRVAITLSHKGRVLRLNYGNWAVLQFYGPEYSKYDLGIALFDDQFDLLMIFKNGTPLKTVNPVSRFLNYQLRSYNPQMRNLKIEL